MGNDSGNPIILYDGVCGLCNRIVQFVLRRDRRNRFLFAALQSKFGVSVLERHGPDSAALKTLYVVVPKQRSERLLPRSEAAIYVLRELGGIWRMVAWLMCLVPTGVCDWGYDRIASVRYRIFGRYDACPIPSPEVRCRFIDPS